MTTGTSPVSIFNFTICWSSHALLLVIVYHLLMASNFILFQNGENLGVKAGCGETLGEKVLKLLISVKMQGS